jgi:hypothetical protein
MSRGDVEQQLPEICRLLNGLREAGGMAIEGVEMAVKTDGEEEMGGENINGK